MLNATAQIVVALVAANKVPAADVPVLINTVYSALLHVDGAPKALPQQPAVPIKRSIQGDYLVCLEDGAKLKVMARYLKARFDLTPAAYRAKWGLPRDYPMVAPSHSIRLSKLAKHLGLGDGVADDGETRTRGAVRAARGRGTDCAHSRAEAHSS